MRTLSTLFLLFLTISPALAEDTDEPVNLKEYDVEIIIFEDAHARYLNSQTWNQKEEPLEPAAEAIETPEDLDKLSLNEINATSYSTIKPKILNKEYQRINASKEYDILFYGSWRQTGLDDTKAFEININDLENTHAVTSKNTLTGNFTLVLARYLHIYAELDYQRESQATELLAGSTDTSASDITETINQDETLQVKMPAGTAMEAQAKNNSFPINIHRRMRSKELHYIDHPLIGVLIQINPVKKVENALKEQ